MATLGHARRAKGSAGGLTGALGCDLPHTGDTRSEYNTSASVCWEATMIHASSRTSSFNALTRAVAFGSFLVASGVLVTDAAQAQNATCKSGFVWRVARPSDLVCVTPESRSRVAEENRTASSRIVPGGGASGPFTCLSGFVWREAFDGDFVCVTPEVRTLVREENQQAASRRMPQ